jgi:hypothetical protein
LSFGVLLSFDIHIPVGVVFNVGFEFVFHFDWVKGLNGFFCIQVAAIQGPINPERGLHLGVIRLYTSLARSLYVP